jgi:3-dehydroquinate dehydratase / shikimate dehydrogenase
MLQAVFSIDWGHSLGGSLFGDGVRRICGVVAASTAREMQVLVLRGLGQTPTLELRLDWLASDSERHKFLKWLKARRFSAAQLIATCRRRIGGGEFTSDAGAELFWLTQAREAGCAWCDLEVETLEELPGETVRGYPVPEKVLLSFHDFRKTPRLPKRVSLPAGAGVDALKIAGMAQTISDSQRLLRTLRGSRNVVAVPMGEVGLPARILALREGSALAYAPVAAATAPGQVGLHELKNLYRAHKLSRRTRVFGVIGDPIGHSLSPLLHNTGYIARKKDAVLLPFLVSNLGEFLKAAPEFGVAGFSVTLPHKKAIFRYLDDCEPRAEEIGAVNTVTVDKNGRLVGSNTDYIGVVKALSKKMKLAGSRVVIFGAGGSARAAAFAVAKAGGHVLVCARRAAPAKELARTVGGEVIKRRHLRTTMVDALLNATPVGMYPKSQVSPLSASELHCSLVMDLIYRPMRTKLLQTAATRRIKTVSGVEMFVAQGVAQWELWMGRRAPEAAMKQAVLGALQSEEKLRW